MNMFFQRQKSDSKKQRGFLSLEVIVVLLIVLGLIGLGASKMDMLSGNAQATEELSNLQALYASTKGLKSTSGYGAAGTNLVPTLITSKAIPKNITVVGTEIYNLHGGTITIVSNGANFTITNNALPAEACIKLSKEAAKAGLFVSTQINSNALITSEVTSATAATQCSGATNTIAWATAA